MRRTLRFAAIGALALMTGGCSWFGGGNSSKLACPATIVAPGLESYQQFRPGGGTALADVEFGAKIVSAVGNCQRDEKGITADVRITFVAARGDPNLKQGDFTYFVAVADAAQKVLAKQTFTLRAEFATRQREMRIADTVAEHLPLRNVNEGRNYAVIVGMQLSRQQLDAVRRQSAK